MDSWTDLIPVLVLLTIVTVLAVVFWQAYRKGSVPCPICDKPGAKEHKAEWGTRWECENCGSVMVNHR